MEDVALNLVMDFKKRLKNHVEIKRDGKQKDLPSNQRKNCRMVEVYILKPSYLSARKLQWLQSGILQSLSYHVV